MVEYDGIGEEIIDAVMRLYEHGGGMELDEVGDVFRSNEHIAGLMAAIGHGLVRCEPNRIWMIPSLMYRMSEVAS